MSTDSATSSPHRPRADWHYHFLGIGGVGMSALAEILHRRGIRVSGSDANGGPALEALSAAGIPTQVGHGRAGFAAADVVVYSTAVGPEHPVWREVEALGLPRLHRAQLLGGLAAGQRSLAVTGTHGKTTTTAALGHALVRCGADPTVIVGGHVPQMGGRNWRAGEGEWMVLEADESDASFLHLAPEAVLLTNVEADHLDFHGSIENMEAAFRAFLGKLPANGLVVYCADDPGARRLVASLSLEPAQPGTGAAPIAHVSAPRLVGYGSGETTAFGVEVRATGQGGARVAFRQGRERREIAVKLIGAHNALNLCGVYALGCSLGLPEQELLEAIGDFRGVARRQEFVGTLEQGPGRGLAIYDDYAHHPTEIRATLESFLAVYGPPVTVVFQPHLYSRTARFAQDFAEALRPATAIYVTDIYGAREAPVPGVTSALITDALLEHPAAAHITDWREMAGRVRAGAVPPGLLLTLGAGDITGLGPYLLRELG